MSGYALKSNGSEQGPK